MANDVNNASFSSNDSHNGAFIVYINGIEVPAKSVTEREGVWQIPEMQVEMVADPVLTRLGAEDRVQVVVFAVDDIKVDKTMQPVPTLRLFGEGEIIGWGYRNTPTGRSIIFTCHNQFAIFQQLYVQFLTNQDDMVAHFSSPSQGSTGLVTPTSQIIFPFSLFRQGLIGKGVGSAPDTIRRPFDFLYNVVRNMIGTSVPAAQRSVPAANFFSRWARLTNFVNRFVAMPSFDEGTGDGNIFPVLKALQNVGAVDVIAKNLAPQVQNQGSIMDMLQLIYQTVLMEIAMLARMPLLSVDLKTGSILETKFEARKLTQDATSKGKRVSATKIDPLKPNRIANYFAKPQMLFGLPPSCNVIFPSQLKMFSYEENFATQPTRLYFNDEVLPLLFKMQQNGLGAAVQNALTSAWPPEAAAALASQASNPKSNGKNFLLFPEEFFKGPVMDRRPVPTWLFFLRQQELAAAKKGQSTPDTKDDPSAPSGVAAGQEAFFDKLKNDNPDVYRLYAQYEFYRERYSRRSGSAVVSYNPYIAPGFPAAIFDNRATRVDIFCYVITVQQTLTQRSRETSFSFAYGRTMQEMFDLMSTEFQAGGNATCAGPREPIREIREVIQGFDEAEAFYQKLFYGDRTIPGKTASFDWRKIIAYAPLRPGLPPERIFVNGVSDKQQQNVADAGKTLLDLTPAYAKAKQDYAVAAQEKAGAEETLRQIASGVTNSLEQGDLAAVFQDIHDARLANILPTADQRAVDDANATLTATTILLEQLAKTIAEYEAQLSAAQSVVNDAAQKTAQVSHNLRGDRELVPVPGKENLFKGYDEAMSYNWRPICSLDEYVIFHDSAGEGLIPASGHPRSIGVAYYARIRRLSPLTSDTVLPTNVDGLTVPLVKNENAANQSTVDPTTGEAATNPASTPTVTGATSSFPQTRAAWDKILLAYRENTYHVTAPRT